MWGKIKRKLINYKTLTWKIEISKSKMARKKPTNRKVGQKTTCKIAK